ncbi:MAG: aspartate kinase [Planctomycetota bacterium]
MGVVVQKFGGSSVAEVAKMRRCAEKAIAARKRGHDVVVVVSAMGKTTDGLVALADEASPTPPRRELDMLLSSGERISIAVMAMVLDAMGQPSISFTGRQIDFMTDAAHTQAKVASVGVEKIRQQLADGRVVVIAGFQGVTSGGEITTLGRGGSDTTAVAIAAALGASACEIYTDVEGVYTADPRVVPDARRLDVVDYESVLQLASTGAKVLHSRSVELAAAYRVPLWVKHSQTDAPGTLITTIDEVERRMSDLEAAQEAGAERMERLVITGVALKDGLGRVTLDGIPDRPGIVAGVFGTLAEAGVNVDDIIQTVVTPSGDGERHATVSFTVDDRDIHRATPVIETLLGNLGGSFSIDTGFAKVSAAGVGIRSHAGAAATMFKALAEEGINISNISTSEIKISALVAADDGKRALQAVHAGFGLGDDSE